MTEKRCLHFTVSGSYITEMAREKLFVEKDLASALRILRGSLESDDLTPDEQLMLCLQVLHGAASIKGMSGSDDYGVEFRDDYDERPTDLASISELISGMDREAKEMQEKYDGLCQKFAFLAEQLPQHKLDEANADYYNSTGGALFPDMPIADWRKSENGLSGMSGMLESFMAQQRYEAEKEADGDDQTDYGWLEPDGTFHPVEWGMHSDWAYKWLEEHRPRSGHPEIYTWKGQAIAGGDVLVHSLGWVLFDSPHHGVPKPTYDESRGRTKAQTEWLFDYYSGRGMKQEANALYED